MKLYYILLLLFTSCSGNEDKTYTPCFGQEKSFSFGGYSFSLPDCYKIYYWDSLENKKSIIRGNLVKLEFDYYGLSTIDPFKMENKSKEEIVINDTIHGHFLRQISYYPKGEGYGFYFYCIDLTKDTMTIFDWAKKETFQKDILKETNDSSPLVDKIKKVKDSIENEMWKKNTTMANHRYHIIFSAYTNDAVSLSKEEIDLFIKSFKHGSIIIQGESFL